MEKQGIAPEVLVSGGAAGLAVLVILLAMTGDPGTPVGFLLGVGVVAIIAAVAGLQEHARARAQVGGRVAVPVIRLVGAVPAPRRPVMVAAVASHGACALGFSVGDRWAVDARGRLSRPLCEAAIAALGPLLLLDGANGGAAEAQCECPLRRGAVTFALQAR